MKVSKWIGGICAATCLLAAAPSYAVEVTHPAGACNNMIVKGSWGYSEQGSITLPQISPAAIKFGQVGVFVLDGTGGGSGVGHVSLDGQIIPNVPLASIQYEVKPDCTGTASFLPGGDPAHKRTIRFVLMARHQELQWLNTTPGSVIVGVAKRR